MRSSALIRRAALDPEVRRNFLPDSTLQGEADLGMHEFPAPDALWATYRQWKGIGAAEEPIVLEPYYDDGSGKEPRYYQRNAINAAVEAIAKGRDRVLLVSWVWPDLKGLDAQGKASEAFKRGDTDVAVHPDDERVGDAAHPGKARAGLRLEEVAERPLLPDRGRHGAERLGARGQRLAERRRHAETSNSRSASLSDTFLSVASLRRPTMRAQGIW